MQYDTRLDDFTTGNGAIEYRRDDDRIVQLKYRYASSQYIKTTLTSYSTAQNYRDGISQMGMTASWPIADRWSVVGAYYYDTKMSKTANQMLGLQYNSCCYAISIGYERKINDWGLQQTAIEVRQQDWLQHRATRPELQLRSRHAENAALEHTALPKRFVMAKRYNVNRTAVS
ncbi:Organic solvent tolerance protein [Pluralibacter gergoviae]|nr:Organic solvent tolerance protein [Pluralibacter gergoviae]